MSNDNLIPLLNRLEKARIKLSLEGENLGLVCDGDPEPALLNEIKENKNGLLAFLREAVLEQQTALPVMPEGTPFPLTHSQRRIWLHEQVEKGTGVYHIYGDLLVHGEMDSAVLLKSLDCILQQHAALRTFFFKGEEGPLQQVKPFTPGQPPVTVHELEQTYTQPFPEEIARLRRSVPLNPETGHLLHLHVFRFKENTTLLSLCIHHIIADAISLAVIFRDFIGAWQQSASGCALEIPAADSRYAGFVQWETENMQGPGFAQSKQYWLSQFSSEPVPLTLSGSRERKNKRTYRGGVEQVKLDARLVSDLRRFLQRQQITPFSYFLSTLQILLHTYSGETDITVGTSTHGRDMAGLSGQVGLFAKAFPLRAKLEDGVTALQLMQQAQTLSGNMLAHQFFPFDLLVEETAFSRDPSRSPFFDIMIDYFPVAPLPAMPGFSFTQISFPRETSKFDATFTFNDAGADITLSVEYNTDIFRRHFIQELLASYEYIMKGMIAFPERSVFAIPAIDHLSREKIINEFGSGYFQSTRFSGLGSLLNGAAEENAQRDAVTCNGNTLNYATLNDTAASLAAYLQQNYHIGPGKTVALMLERSERLVIAVLAVIKTGAIFLPVDAGAPAVYNHHILSDSNAGLLITDAHWLGELDGVYEGPVFTMDIELDMVPPQAFEPVNMPAEAPAYILYTSGSTGKPKGVIISNGNICNYLTWAAGFYCHELPPTRVPWFTSFSFDLSLTSLFVPLLRGDLLEIFPQALPTDAFTRLLNTEADYGLMKLTPSHIHLLDLFRNKPLRVARVIVGGEALTGEQVRILRNANPEIKIYNEYGPTETTVGCTVEEIAGEAITIGRPVGNTYIYILNRALEPVPVGCPGEICVGGFGVGTGYHNLPELTAEKFLNNPFHEGKMYRTGDAGKWLPDGRIEYLGRIDNQVKINGYRIEPGAVEAAFAQFAFVERAVALVTGEQQERVLTVFYSGEKQADDYFINASRFPDLPAYMLPGQVIHVATWPLTPNGKTDNKALLRLAAGIQKQGNSRLPETHEEIELARFFEELLHVKQLGVDDNLFTMGLDSLKAVKAQTLLEEKFPGRVQVHDLFSQATVTKLVKHIHNLPETEPAAPGLIDF